MTFRRSGAPRLRAPRTEKTRPAKDAIADALKLNGIAEEVRAERVFAEWTELVGPRIAARTRPDGISNIGSTAGDRVLYIEVASSAWLQELNLLRAEIFLGLIERLGKPQLFDELKFRIAGRSSRPRPVPPAPRPRTPRTEKPLPAPASGLAREQIVRETDAVDDAELRELIARVRITFDR